MKKSIGRFNAVRKGRTEPVPVELKDGRKGLGHAAAIQQRKQDAMRRRSELLQRRQRRQQQHQLDFRSRQRQQQLEKEVSRDLMKSQKTCFQLDSREVSFSMQQHDDMSLSSSLLLCFICILSSIREFSNRSSRSSGLKPQLKVSQRQNRRKATKTRRKSTSTSNVASSGLKETMTRRSLRRARTMQTTSSSQ